MAHPAAAGRRRLNSSVGHIVKRPSAPILVALIVWLAITCASSCFAACFDDHPTVSREYKQSYAVVLGRVIREAQTPASRDLYEGTTYAVRTISSFRGHLPRTFSVFSENSSGRFPMVVGSSYLLFIYPMGNRLAVGNCGHSGLASEQARAISALKRLR